MNYFKKTNFIILLLIYSFKVLSYENSILAIVENQVITLNDFKKFNKKSATENDIHALINQLVLELEIKSKNIQLAREQSSQAIINLAKTNNLTIDQLLSIKGIEKTIELVKLEISKKILKDSVIKSAKIQLNDKFASVGEVGAFILAERAAKRQELQNVLTTALKVDSETKMGLVQDIKQELRKVSALKINYTTRVGDYSQNIN